MKKLSILTLGLIIALIGGLAIGSDANEVQAEDCGIWVQADRYGRYPCAGPPDDCFELCPIIIIGTPV
jgi:hypothetical protein